MTEPAVTIRGSRLRLLLQAGIIVAAGTAAGWLLQAWEPISRSLIGRLDAQVPLPLVLVVVAGLAVAIAVALVRDSWTHAVELGEHEMHIRTGQGAVVVPYSAVAYVRALPQYGVGIALRDPDAWLRQVEGTPGSPPAQRQISQVLRNAWGVDIGIVRKNLDVEPAAFVELLERRTRPS